jgi:signal transduction histidine kinase/ActR/RegA family two-component response regulator
VTETPPKTSHIRAWRGWVQKLRQGDKERIYDLTVFITVLNFAIFTFVPLEAEPVEVNALSLLVALLTWWLRRCAHIGYSAAMTLLVGIAFFNITYTVVQNNGILSGVISWYFVLPLPVLMTLGVRALPPLILVTLVTVGAVAFAQWSGWLPDYTPPDDEIIWRFVSFAAMMLSVLALPLLYQDIQGVLIRGLTKRNQELSEAQARLLQEQHQKDQFVASVSHELRTPMNAIIGFLQAIDRERDVTPKSREMLAHMDHSSKHLLTIINDLLDFSQLQTGKLRLQNAPFDLYNLATELGHMFRPLLSEKGVALTTEIAPEVPQWVMGDADRINQILINLMGNATKFTSNGRVGLRVSAEVSGQVRFDVTDTGPGISAQELPRIFDRFSDITDRTRRAFGGTGLGLSISKQLTELQQGTIGVQSTLGEGSSFVVHLPLVSTPAPQDTETTPHTPDVAHLRGHVLVVDDSAVNRIVAKQLLLSALPHLEIDEANDGAHALSQCLACPYDVVLMDVVMPNMNGIEATQAIRSHSAIAVQPLIIGLTANVTGETRAQGLASGMDSMISKPYQRQALIQAVAQRLHAPTTSTSSI